MPSPFRAWRLWHSRQRRSKISAGANWSPQLNRKAGRPVRLSLAAADGGARWQDDYQLVPCGLMKPPIVITRKPVREVAE